MITALQKIKAILDTISTTYLPVKFEFLESQPASFPAGCLLSQGLSEEIFDTDNNLVTETFVIKIIVPQNESQAGMEQWVNLADLIAAEFRKNTHQTLDGTAITMFVKQITPPEFSDAYTQPVVVITITLEVKVIRSIN